MATELTLAALASIAISLILNRGMLKLAPGLGLMDQPGERRIHAHPIPRAGGIAIWLTFVIVVGVILATGFIQGDGNLTGSWFGAFVAGSAVLMVAGFADDRVGLSPFVKLGAHILAPTVFFLLHPFHTGIFPADWPAACDYAVFVVWVVVLINAFNLIDGLDGLCGGLAAVSSLALAGIALANGRTDSAVLLLVMAGAILGFLKYNFNPARIFLGDAGSMLIGFFLATAATDAVGRKAVVGIILLPIAVAGVPLLDVLLAIWRRGSRRLLRQLHGEKIEGGIFDADSDHLHHRLLSSGGSQRKAAAVLQGFAIVLAALAFLPMMFGDRVLGISLVGLLIVALVGVKNLARVEIEQTGNAVHMAIKLPSHRRRVAVVLFLYDLIVLAAAATAAAMIETNLGMRGANIQDLARFMILFTILGKISMLIVKVHHRLWVRATIRDILALQFWLLIASVATFSIFSLLYSTLEWSALRLTMMSYVIASVGVSVPRVTLDLLRDFGLDARHLNRKKSAGDEDHWPVVVLGAGDLGTLLLEHLKSTSLNRYPGMRLLGFIDETRMLHGRRLRSFRIFGGLSVIPKLVEEAGLKGIILAIDHPRKELLGQLEELADQYDLKIYRWQVGVEEI
jgi:UDP-N-acetylmuramyl pentapeptide phosphotransferase/UDP-N-acetylglucosamine-1-phosphate transferase